MKHLLLTAHADINESLRSRWFLIYSLIFGGIVVALFVTGLTESRVMGFTGLSRLLVTYLQITMAVLPLFVLITTVRSVAGDREAGIFEYLLSLPVGLAAWFWGKMIGRFVVVFLPVVLAMLLAVVWAVGKGAEVPWVQLLVYTGLLVSLAWCFLGLGMLLSTLARSADVAQGSAFMIWLLLLLFLDLILLGIMTRTNLPVDNIVAIALANPLQVFRTASMMLFDPQLVLLGPSAYVILDNFGETGFISWALIYPVLLGTACAGIGYLLFRRGDLP
ncbi:ABC transporter permease [Solemya velum gill symbiont]|uniref:ABC transporter permease n=1 Tax=Solemya velum gill symbiont TaxID=2340 RepID=A0A1T2CGM9_SOVGS|nr:ABC transporter permease subunit [Solemya velum gill symbiont]OOY33864.1 ABC transporter permease [Solemya velum gill symbiont]OOY36483.1 ABC transporter permease [Solemya velum gill symbiont]OOY39074.1 ABC transporter permease [Solemya velum gill symbiont]OOY43330.1 ABC transporter permease [Solemya velum gill symbiont]OOY45568.1 ABC transporter permease [Solemya velum gill symbiont]